MAITFNGAHEVEAISLDNKVGLFAGDNTPDIDVSGAPIGSEFKRTNGDIYDKTGAGDALSDWTIRSAAVAASSGSINFSIIGW